MKNLIISFKNRNNLLAFNKILVNRGIPTKIINTPRSIAISCGLSIKTDFKFYNLVLNLLNQSNASGFIGMFLYEQIGSHEQIQRLY